MTIEERIRSYLGNGGLFNPEMMEHDKVRDLVMACRGELERRDGLILAAHRANGGSDFAKDEARRLIARYVAERPE